MRAGSSERPKFAMRYAVSSFWVGTSGWCSGKRSGFSRVPLEKQSVGYRGGERAAHGGQAVCREDWVATRTVHPIEAMVANFSLGAARSSPKPPKAVERSGRLEVDATSEEHSAHMFDPMFARTT
jgi:hypothetical protein